MWSPQLDRMRHLENEIIQRVLTQARIKLSPTAETRPSNESFDQFQARIKESQLKSAKNYVLWSFVGLVFLALVFVRNHSHSDDISLQANPDDDDATAKMNDVVNQFRQARKAKAASAISEYPAASQATTVAPRMQQLIRTPWFQPDAAAIDLNLPALKDRKAVVVGNGESIRGSKMGSAIDSYKTVIRFNLYKTKGYEVDVGRKTNIWVLSSIKDPNDMDPEEIQGVRQALVNLPDDSKEWKIKDSKRRLDNCKTLPATTKTWAGMFKKETDVLRKDYGLKEKFLSSGLQLLMHFALKYGTVAFIGFDFGTGSHQHYWETKQKNETCHNMFGEAKVIEKMVSEGLLYRLGKAPKINADTSFDTYDPNCKIVCYADGGCKKLTGQAYLDYMKNPLAWEDKHGMRSLGKRVDSKMYAKEKRKFRNKRKRNGR